MRRDTRKRTEFEQRSSYSMEHLRRLVDIAMPLVSRFELFGRPLQIADFAHTAHVGLGSRRGSSEHNPAAGIGESFTMDTVLHRRGCVYEFHLVGQCESWREFFCASRSRPGVGLGKPV